MSLKSCLIVTVKGGDLLPKGIDITASGNLPRLNQEVNKGVASFERLPINILLVLRTLSKPVRELPAEDSRPRDPLLRYALAVHQETLSSPQRKLPGLDGVLDFQCSAPEVVRSEIAGSVRH